MGIVYKIENKITKESYIGSTVNFRKRVFTHKLKLKKNCHSSKLLQESYNKYGVDNFDYVIISECENFREVEQKLLNETKYVLNARRVATGGDMISNHINKDLIIKKSIEILRNCKQSPRYGDKNSNWRGGISKTSCLDCGSIINGFNLRCRKCFYKQRDISGAKNPFYNKHHSEETKEKIRKKNLGKKNIAQSKPLLIHGIEYGNLSEASIALGINLTTIRHRVISANPKFIEYKYLKNSNDYPEGEYTISL